MPTETTLFYGTLAPVGNWDLTFTAGTRHATCVVEVAPDTPIPAGATLLLREAGDSANPQIIEFFDCVTGTPALRKRNGIWVAAVPIYDRRWRWQFGTVSGDFNAPLTTGGYRREQTPQQLATLCFAAMGEATPDVSRMPNSARPRRFWEYSNARDALDSLCAEMGCVATLNPLTNQAEIWPIGDGRALPSLPADGLNYTAVAKPKPETLRVVGGRTLIETTLEAPEPWGLDTDGAWKPIDNLSYTPGAGWAKEPPQFPNVTGTYFDGGQQANIRDLARSTVWKNYRITRTKQFLNYAIPILVDAGLEPLTIDDFALESERATNATSPTGEPQRLPHFVHCTDWRQANALVLYQGGTAIDAVNGLVRFPEPVFTLGTNTIAPAVVEVTTGFTAGYQQVFHAMERSTAVPGGLAGSGTRTVRVPSLRGRVIYGSQVISNETEFNAAADAVLAQVLAEYDNDTSQTVDYDGIAPISPDGDIRQVTWRAGPERVSRTIASRGRAHDTLATDAEKERIDKLLAAVTDQTLKIGQQAERPLWLRPPDQFNAGIVS